MSARAPRIGRGAPAGRAPGALPVSDVLAAAGLIAIAALTLTLLTGNLPLVGGNGGGGGGGGGPLRTATPSNVVIVDPRVNIPGSILYVKAGNLWLQHGEKATELTSSGSDSMPSFSPDGQWIYFIRTTDETGRWRIGGLNRRFRLATPALMRVRTDASAAPEVVLTGTVTSGSNHWSYFLRQPVVGPDGTIIVVTDGPDPSAGDVVLKRLDPKTGKLTSLKAPEVAPLGHQDPAWSPDGHYLLFVKNARDGSRGAPVVMRYDVTTGKAGAVTGPGYASPSWSPDGRFIAATRTTSFGTDIVILDARRGAELLRITTNERSFDPVWSPAGNAIAYLSLDGGVTDLWMAKITVAATPALDGNPLQLTISAGLDAASRPDWWIPASLLPTAPPTATPAATLSPPGSTAPGASGSTTP